MSDLRGGGEMLKTWALDWDPKSKTKSSCQGQPAVDYSAETSATTGTGVTTHL